jgi:hypothetical protein
MTDRVVYCNVCKLRKKPIGRSAPLEMANSLCDYECQGYMQEPRPGQLWPGEECPECHDEGIIQAGYADDLPEYIPCWLCRK